MMDIATEIAGLSSRIQAAYDELQNKGATMPEQKTSYNLAATISSIPEAPAAGNMFFICNPQSGSMDIKPFYMKINDSGLTASGVLDACIYENVSSVAFQADEWNGINGQDIVVVFADGTTQDISSDTTLSLSQSAGIIQWNKHLCLAGDAMISLVNGGQKRIDELMPGDSILAFDPYTLQLTADEISYSDSTEEKYGDSKDIWTFDDGTSITTINPHEFYNVEQQKFCYIADFKTGEHALKADKSQVALVGHKKIEEKTRHFTLLTKKFNNYFANGILAGNRHSVALQAVN